MQRPAEAPDDRAAAGSAAIPPEPAIGGEFEGEFETHVTVSCDDASRVEDLRAWAHAEAPGTKVTHIVLSRGRMRSQPMLTLTGSGTLADQNAAALELAGRLAQAGFPVCRLKIEAAPWASGVPRDEAEAAALGPEYYFEHHVKLLLDADFDLEGLGRLAEAHHAHVSWNARRVEVGDGDGQRHERFVTQRCRGVGNPQAAAELEALCSALITADYTIVKAEREFVVRDSAAELDQGWINDAWINDALTNDGRTDETH